jgi:hypothetical protein
MVPYKTLFQPEATFSFIERTFHREMNGGYERWEFEINNKRYLFNGDIRYLPETQQNVLVIDFMVDTINDGITLWEYQKSPDAETSKVLGCLIEIADKVLQFREFKYIATLSSPEWRTTSYNFLQNICNPVTEKVASEVLVIIKPNFQTSIDMDFHSLDIGDLSVNPSYKAP